MFQQLEPHLGIRELQAWIGTSPGIDSTSLRRVNESPIRPTLALQRGAGAEGECVLIKSLWRDVHRGPGSRRRPPC